jgi:hypothetical protein
MVTQLTVSSALCKQHLHAVQLCITYPTSNTVHACRERHSCLCHCLPLLLGWSYALHIPESINTLTQSCAYLLQLNAQPGQILSKVGASLISLPHVDLHEVQLGFMRRQPPLQLSALLSPLVLLHLQELKSQLCSDKTAAQAAYMQDRPARFRLQHRPLTNRI